MKKTALTLCMTALFLLVACHHSHCAEKVFRIVASTFPVYQFTANICAGASNVNVELLVPAAAGCPHDFALKPADIQKLANADAIVINGAGLEEFLTKPLAGLKKKPPIIDAGANVPVLDDDPQAQDHVNPHIFASPANACIMVTNIATRLAGMELSNIPLYNKNATEYVARLTKISNALKKIGSEAKNRGIALEHDALAYLAANAGLDIVAVFENTASASQLAKIKTELETRKPALLAGDAQYPDRLLKTLAEETKLPYTQLNPCSAGPDSAPLDYYESVMQSNLEILEKFFGKN